MVMRRGTQTLKQLKTPIYNISATVPCGYQWSVYDVLGWFCGPGLGSGSGTGFLSLKGSQGVALISRGVTFFHVFFVTHFPTL